MWLAFFLRLLQFYIKKKNLSLLFVFDAECNTFHLEIILIFYI